MDKQKKLSRRDFLKLAGGAIGATTLACCGLTTLGMWQPEVDFLETGYGDENEMKDKILVAYASKCGATGEVADAIGQVLSANGTAVDVRLVENVPDPSLYRAVVVGSAIRMGKWLSEATKFVETHQEALSQTPTAYFTVCMTLQDDTEENRRTVAAYLDPVREILEPVDVGLFAGMMDYSKLSFLDRLIAKMVKTPEGDFRNWEAIRAWANDLRPVLLSTP